MSETNNNMARRALTWDEFAIGYEKLKSANDDMLAAMEDASRELHFLHNSSLAAEMIADKCDAAIAKAEGGAK
jgi:hypothetical protein